MNYTKGPWTVIYSEDVGTYFIPECAKGENDGYESGSEICRNNGNLISAAPEMFNLLNEIYMFMSQDDHRDEQLYTEIIDVINKAKGS